MSVSRFQTPLSDQIPRTTSRFQQKTSTPTPVPQVKVTANPANLLLQSGSGSQANTFNEHCKTLDCLKYLELQKQLGRFKVIDLPPSESDDSDKNGSVSNDAPFTSNKTLNLDQKGKQSNAPKKEI